MALTTEKTAVESKLIFSQFRVTKYSDGTYQYENYPYFFPHQVAALAWGRAYDQAQKDLVETQKYIKELLDQVSGN
jgi:hypothetical protein